MSSAELLRIDLHVHTWGSWDCLSDPERVLERAAERGVRRIAITDHNEVEVALEMARRYPDRVIPGEEVRTAEGVDVIGLYLSDRIPEGTAAEEVCARVHSMGGLAYLPHPYARGKGGSGRLAEALAPLVDIVEVFNARLHPTSLNAPATELASRWDRPSGAGSDAHSLREVAGAYVEVRDHPNDPASLIRALRDGSVAGLSAPWSVHLSSTWAKIRRRLAGGP